MSANQAALESDDEPPEPPEEPELDDPDELEDDELDDDDELEDESELDDELPFEAEPAELYRSEYQPPPFRMKPPPREI